MREEEMRERDLGRLLLELSVDGGRRASMSAAALAAARPDAAQRVAAVLEEAAALRA